MPTSLCFPCSTKKIAQATAVLLQQEPNKKTKYIRILKMLYRADRESIQEIGVPIIGIPTWALPKGPLHSKIKNLIKHEPAPDPEAEECPTKEEFQLWDTFFEVRVHTIKLIKDPGISQLSEYDIEKLTTISRRYKGKDPWSPVHDSHEFPEWKEKQALGPDSNQIYLDDILKALGMIGQKGSIEELMSMSNAAENVFGTRD